MKKEAWGKKVKELEIMNANNLTPIFQSDLHKYKLQLNEHINNETTFLIQRLRHEYVEYCNKFGKYLANQSK